MAQLGSKKDNSRQELEAAVLKLEGQLVATRSEARGNVHELAELQETVAELEQELIQVRSDLSDESNQVLEKGAQIVELKDTVRAMEQDQAEKEAENEQQMAEWKSEIQELRHLSDANDDKQNQLEDYRAQMLEGQQSHWLLELQQEKAQQAAESNAQAKKDLETHLHEKEQQLFDKHLELKDALSPPRQQGWFTQSVPAQPDIRDEMTKLQKEL